MTVALVVMVVLLGVTVLGLASYSLSLRGILRGAIVAADGYAPGGRDHVRLPYNLACRWARYHGQNYPYKVYTNYRGVHVPEDRLT